MLSGTERVLRAVCLFITLIGLLLGFAAPSMAVVVREDNSDFARAVGIPLYIWKDDRLSEPEGIVVAVHGFAQQAGAMNAIAENLGRQGYLVVGPDLRGHGRWGDSKESMESDLLTSCDDVAGILRSLHKEYPKAKIYLIGESTGSGVVMSAVAKEPKGVSGVILCAAGSKPFIHNPMTMGSDFIKGMATLVTQVDIKSYLEHYLSDDARVAKEMIQDPLSKKSESALQLLGTMQFIKRMPSFAASLPAGIPLLIMQGAEDKIVSAESAQPVFLGARSRDKAFVNVPGSGHILIGTSYIKPRVITCIDNWLVEHGGIANPRTDEGELATAHAKEPPER